MTQALPKKMNSIGDLVGGGGSGFFKNVSFEQPASPTVPEEPGTFSVATRDPSGMPPSSRLPTPFEGGSKRAGDTKKKQARKELLGD